MNFRYCAFVTAYTPIQYPDNSTRCARQFSPTPSPIVNSPGGTYTITLPSFALTAMRLCNASCLHLCKSVAISIAFADHQLDLAVGQHLFLFDDQSLLQHLLLHRQV